MRFHRAADAAGFFGRRSRERGGSARRARVAARARVVAAARAAGDGERARLFGDVSSVSGWDWWGGLGMVWCARVVKLQL